MIILLMVDNILSSPCMLSYKTSITKNSKAIIFTACNYKKEMKSNPSYGEKWCEIQGSMVVKVG